MINKKDISSIDDIKLMVNTFYDRIKLDKLLGPIFNERIQDRWPQHLEKMYRFWQTILLNEHTYNGSPFPPHANMPVDVTHFNLWVQIFHNTVNDLFSGPIADEAKYRGELMASIFNSKIDYLNANN
ncbi:MAG: group III truncated hemoglobin [Bacteroidetes bacterium]|nr:group III truncated hemoglobin [Bacteroidota bacterium]